MNNYESIVSINIPAPLAKKQIANSKNTKVQLVLTLYGCVSPYMPSPDTIQIDIPK